MSQLARTAIAAVLGGIVVVAAGVAFRPTAVVAAPTATTATEPAHVITVTAVGKVTLVPDVARVSLGITVNRPTVEAARSDAGKVMTAIIASVKAKGVDAKDVQTTGINLSPQYEPCIAACTGPGKIVGYTMNEQIQVTVRDLDKAGGVIDAATAAGATNVGGISFEVADPEAALAQARAQAIRAARTKADAMAQVAGVTVTGVVSIEEASGSTPVPYAAAMSAAGDVKTPVSPGTTEVQATVTMVFDIE